MTQESQAKDRVVRLLTSGLEVLDFIGRNAAKSKWLALGTFGLATELVALRVLPKASSIIVGLPHDAEEKHSTIFLRLRVLKKTRPELQIAARTDFHAKYCLFEKENAKLVLIGSANITASPAIESAVVLESSFLFEKLRARHEHWLKGAKEITPDQTPKMDRVQLSALRSLTIDSK